MTSRWKSPSSSSQDPAMCVVGRPISNRRASSPHRPSRTPRDGLHLAGTTRLVNFLGVDGHALLAASVRSRGRSEASGQDSNGHGGGRGCLLFDFRPVKKRDVLEQPSQSAPRPKTARPTAADDRTHFRPLSARGTAGGACLS
eukprot:763163-Hanusia_phi.AAC.2